MNTEKMINQMKKYHEKALNRIYKLVKMMNTNLLMYAHALRDDTKVR